MKICIINKPSLLPHDSNKNPSEKLGTIHRKSRYANPVLMLDEIDKVSSDSRHNPLGPMYSLLEKHTAKRFVDEYLGVPFDVSNVIWIASANYVERIPEPIRSRMIESKLPRLLMNSQKPSLPQFIGNS